MQLAVESDRERLQQQGQVDPWFLLLEAAVACVVSNQPEYVAQLYELAVHFAPESAEASIRGSLEVYSELGIGGGSHDQNLEIGCIGTNVARALKVLQGRPEALTPSDEGRLAPDVRRAARRRVPRRRHRAFLPQRSMRLVKRSRQRSTTRSGRLENDRSPFGIAAGANGGDLLFHEICRRREIPTRMCLALRKPQYVGQYVAPAGREWVERFSELYRYIAERQANANLGVIGRGAQKSPTRSHFRINTFSESSELPRWLQGKSLYNVGRRNNQWMLQHAIAAANQLGPDTEITLLALWDERPNGEIGVGGISDVTRKAAMQGIKIVSIKLPGAATPAISDMHGNGVAGDAAPNAAAAAPARAEAEHTG